MNGLDNNRAALQARPKQKRLWGWSLMLLLFVVYLLFTLMPMVGIVYNSEMYAASLYSVRHELFQYLEKHQQFPPAEKWCDTLLEEDDSYLDYEQDDQGNFPYIINKHIVEHKEPPGNMVVAFFGGDQSGPTTYGKNQVGDMELIKDCPRAAVLLGNGDIHTFRNQQFPYLRWRFEDSGIIPEPDNKFQLLILSTPLVIIFLAVLRACRDRVRQFWILALVVGIVSAGICVFLGVLAELVFYKLMDTTGNFIAPWIGSFLGFGIGVCFIALLGTIYKKYHTNVNMVSYAMVLGPLTGIAASSIVHGYLMIAYGETSFGYMAAGSFFGILGGGLLGLFSSGLILYYQDKTSLQNQEPRPIHAAS